MTVSPWAIGRQQSSSPHLAEESAAKLFLLQTTHNQYQRHPTKPWHRLSRWHSFEYVPVVVVCSGIPSSNVYTST
ncbi:predicted protein [Lichtheimia corymbifera JMRC:FSU:9682]|uniref:Uncharacterized protein n=1 Tax=Lichtheimia corymbifera JMRC:FSU:9682 TaxID=1263082 RepID=A0A068RRV5_9FUNG|nr:predicted protein [Lichtheimia corymbifera JMRC:FSU:9682]